MALKYKIDPTIPISSKELAELTGDVADRQDVGVIQENLPKQQGKRND